MNVRTFMSAKVVTVQMDDSLGAVKDIFDTTHFHHLLVVEEGRLLGVISDRDLLRSISPNVDTVAATSTDMASLNRKAHQIMTCKPVTIDEAASITEAVNLFDTHTISCIPVVNAANKPVGIVSWRDVMREVNKRFKQAAGSS